MKRRRIGILLVILIVVISLGWYFGTNPQVRSRLGLPTQASASGVLASGFIEATDVAIAPETSGRIVSISVDEGDKVTANTLLFRLDDSLLRAQEKQAQAAVSLAQANLDQATASRNQAVVSRDGAKKILDNALDVEKNPLQLDSQITRAQGDLNLAELGLQYNMEISRYQGTVKSEFWTVAFATQTRDNARAALQSLLNIKNNPQDIIGVVDRAQAAYDSASSAVPVAEKAVVITQRQVDQAQASLEVVRTQLAKLTIASPVSGLVSARNAEVGEMAQPGVPVLVVSQIDQVTLTAYVPESNLGLVKVGQQAVVSVDSYPGSDFTGQVTNIGTQALFTPKNVQLKDEREKTVYPVKIKLANPEQKLKAGMPADVRILTQ